MATDDIGLMRCASDQQCELLLLKIDSCFHITERSNHAGKDLTEARSLQRKLVPDMQG
jgi:hypothetical protein